MSPKSALHRLRKYFSRASHSTEHQDPRGGITSMAVIFQNPAGLQTHYYLPQPLSQGSAMSDLEFGIASPSPDDGHVDGLDGEARSYPPSNSRTQASDLKAVKSTSSIPSADPRPGIDKQQTVICRPRTPQPKVLTRVHVAPASLPTTPSSTMTSFSWPPGSSTKGVSSSATTPTSSKGSTPAASGDTQRRYSGKTLASNPQQVPDPTLETITEVGSKLGPFKTVICGEWPPQKKLSIETVERVAAAQVYFERYFNDLYNADKGHTARSLRRRAFESQLQKLSITLEQRQAELDMWARNESDHLRLIRVQKAKTLHQKAKTPQVKDAVKKSISGYEVIRVLGKGSFGVVQLVQELRQDSMSSPRMESAPVPTIVDSLPSPVSDPSVASTVSADYFQEMPRRSQIKPSGKFYAMKTIRKSDMLRSAQEGHLHAERDLLVSSANSEWIVPLIASFQDKTNLYLVMDYMIGGDFLGLLLREDKLDERHAAFWVAEMILCVEEAHNLGWIHRDVKPDNFLIGADGHLKISDFGLSFDGHWSHDQGYYNAKRYGLAEELGIRIRGDSQDEADDERKNTGMELSQSPMSPSITPSGSPWPSSLNSGYRTDTPLGKKQRDIKDAAATPVVDHLNEISRRKRYARSIVGTSQYMAPEVILGEPYDGRCDWWSIGIILYECLYGLTPFFNEERAKTKDNIVNHRKMLYFPQKCIRINNPADEDPAKRKRLSGVSNEAENLIRKLLTEKERRLSSHMYELNDCKTEVPPQLRRASGVPGRRPSKGGGWGGVASGWTIAEITKYTQFRYENDGRDIKKHPFFAMWGINFATIHRTTPPFVPRTHGNQANTRYFEDESDIITETNADPESGSESSRCDCDVDCEVPESRGGRGDRCNGKCRQRLTQVPKDARKDAKKRPRDKILRDPRMCRTALDVRKERAFLGYTYRRPKVVIPGCGEESLKPDFDSARLRRVTARGALPAGFFALLSPA